MLPTFSGKKVCLFARVDCSRLLFTATNKDLNVIKTNFTIVLVDVWTNMTTNHSRSENKF
jgi:hypothetical protein